VEEASFEMALKLDTDTVTPTVQGGPKKVSHYQFFKKLY